MRLLALKLKVLQLLAENAINNISPQVMDTDAIAGALAIKPAETKQLLKILHTSGLIITNMEEQYSLITQAGVDWLNQATFTAQKPKEPHLPQPVIS